MVGMSGANPREEGGVCAEQLRYARLLDYGMKAGLAALIAGFVVYLSGAMPLQVPFEELPRLWTLSLPDYLDASGMATGWGWLAMLGKADVLALAGVALLPGISIPCLLVLATAYAARGDLVYLTITLLLIGVLVLAASGVLTAGH